MSLMRCRHKAARLANSAAPMAAALPDGSAALPDGSLVEIAPTITRSLRSNDSFRTIHQTQVPQHVFHTCLPISDSMCWRHDMAGKAVAWFAKTCLMDP